MCVCVCVCTNIHEIFVYTYDLTYMALYAKIVVEEDTFFYYYRLWFLRVKVAIFLFQIKKNHFLYCYDKQCLVKTQTIAGILAPQLLAFQ